VFSAVPLRRIKAIPTITDRLGTVGSRVTMFVIVEEIVFPERVMHTLDTQVGVFIDNLTDR
jgi:hypothetical protein